jgi:hypothetical protein
MRIMAVQGFHRLFGFALLLIVASSASGAIVANFDGGNGTASSDQWTGIAGNGWATAWGQAGTVTGSTTVTTTSPLSGGGNYLSVVDDTTTASSYIRRQYQSFGDVNINQSYRISFSFRFDGNMTDFTTFTDRLAIFGDSTAQTATGATNSWGIGVAASNSGAGAGQSVYPGEWYFLDNNGSTAFATSNMFDTNLALVGGRVYNITLDVNAVAGSYSASINDGVNPVVSASNLTYRNGTTNISNFFHVSVNGSAAADNSAFSIDNLTISAIPEPAGITAILSACLGAGWMFGKRLRKKISNG